MFSKRYNSDVYLLTAVCLRQTWRDFEAEICMTTICWLQALLALLRFVVVIARLLARALSAGPLTRR